MFCKYCGTENENDVIFCRKCGKKIGGDEGAAGNGAGAYGNGAGSYGNGAGSYGNGAGAYGRGVGGGLDGIIGNVENSYQRRQSARNEREKAADAKYDVNENSPELREIFVDPDEKLIAKLGNGFLVNIFLGKKVRRCFGLLSDKRVYLKGRMYTSASGKLIEDTCIQTLDVEDITGTGFTYKQMPKALLIFLLVLFLLAAIIFASAVGEVSTFFALLVPYAVVAILLILAYIISKKSLFFIEYAGGRIMIDAMIIGIADVQDFQKQMRRVKDKVTGKK